MGFLRRKLTDEERAEELFSPYIDGQVTAEERRFLERYLAGHPQAREKFELLRAAVRLTRTLPAVKAPRSFVLPRSMARRPSPALRLYPAMRLATVAATALLVFALVGDLATSSRLAAPVPAAGMITHRSAVEATQAPAAALPAEAPPAATTATPAPLATPGAALGDAGTRAYGAEGTPAPTAMAEFAAPTGSPPSEPAGRTSGQEPVSTPEATADQSAARLRADAEVANAQAVGATQIDALRFAVIALAGLAGVLAVATLLVRRRAR